MTTVDRMTKRQFMRYYERSMKHYDHLQRDLAIREATIERLEKHLDNLRKVAREKGYLE